MAKVLVTGGAGFIGSHVVDGLVAEGHEVLVVDNLSTGRASNLSPDVKLVELDVFDDEFVSLAKSFNPSVISHLAAQASVPVSMSDPILDARVNILGGLNVVRAAAEVGCEQVIYINTGGALYGEPEYLPCDEDHPIRPISGYALSKWTSECYFRMMLPESILLKALRFANIYGPRQDPHGESGVIAIFARKMLNGETVHIFGDGKNTRDYLYIDDFVEAHDMALNHCKSLVANIGTGGGNLGKSGAPTPPGNNWAQYISNLWPSPTWRRSPHCPGSFKGKKDSGLGAQSRVARRSEEYGQLYEERR